MTELEPDFLSSLIQIARTTITEYPEPRTIANVLATIDFMTRAVNITRWTREEKIRALEQIDSLLTFVEARRSPSHLLTH